LGGSRPPVQQRFMFIIASVNPKLSDLDLLDIWTLVALEAYWKELVNETIHVNDTSSGYIADDETTFTDDETTFTD